MEINKWHQRRGSLRSRKGIHVGVIENVTQSRNVYLNQYKIRCE